MSSNEQLALFVDRDGTVIREAHYLSNSSELELLPGAGEALIRAKDAGCLLFLFTNQSGIGRGYFDLDSVHACNRRMYELMGVEENFFDGVCIAPETPSDTPVYRKPSPRYVLETIKDFELKPGECFVVGDKWTDALAGVRAGANGVLVESGHELDENTRGVAKERGVPVYLDLNAFICSLLD